ncbi:hypothetical protein [Sphaerisporangium sp. NPDC051011]|uniref:hypothetical protein n=1 Tax=Sphaerisporangium sp. NPDC051011 TaxID=3155792 RepID=UPI003406275C
MEMTSGFQEIVPHSGTSEVLLGEDRAALRERLGDRETFRKGKATAQLSDHYSAHGLILHFDDDSKLHSIEFTPPSDPHLYSARLLGVSHSSVLQRLAERNIRVEPEDVGWGLTDLDISLFVSSISEPESPIEAVTMYSKGHRAFNLEFFNSQSPGIGRVHQIIPREGLTSLRLGDLRDDVHEALGPGMTWLSGPGPTISDRFLEEGLDVGYDDHGRIIRIIASPPALAIFEGVDLLSLNYRDAASEMLARGHRIDEKEGEIHLADLGFSIWTARIGDDTLPVCAVAFSAMSGKSRITLHQPTMP